MTLPRIKFKFLGALLLFGCSASPEPEINLPTGTCVITSSPAGKFLQEYASSREWSERAYGRSEDGFVSYSKAYAGQLTLAETKENRLVVHFKGEAKSSGIEERRFIKWLESNKNIKVSYACY